MFSNYTISEQSCLLQHKDIKYINLFLKLGLKKTAHKEALRNRNTMTSSANCTRRVEVVVQLSHFT